NDAMSRLTSAVGGAFKEAFIELAPAIESFAKTITPVVASISRGVSGVVRVVQNLTSVIGFSERTSLPFWLKFSAATEAAALAIGKVIQIVGKLIGMFKLLAKSQAITLALSGPKGWA